MYSMYTYYIYRYIRFGVKLLHMLFTNFFHLPRSLASLVTSLHPMPLASIFLSIISYYDFLGVFTLLPYHCCLAYLSRLRIDLHHLQMASRCFINFSMSCTCSFARISWLLFLSIMVTQYIVLKHFIFIALYSAVFPATPKSHIRRSALVGTL